MGERSNSNPTGDRWNELFSGMSDQFAAAVEANAQAQDAFIESWSDALAAMTDADRLEEGMEGYASAYEVWMNAAEDAMEQTVDAAEGGETTPNDFRDLWLDAANEAFAEVMSTDAFTAATGRRVEDALELRQASDEVAQSTLHDLGFATEGDVREVGERLVELERRQHEVERKLDRLLDAVEGA